jgi:hypothetical protein
MKNQKILPFREWFKVYESAGRNFNQSQRILESKLIKLYEAVLPQTGVTLPAELPVDKETGKIFDISGFGDSLNITAEENQTMYEKGVRVIDSIPAPVFLYGGALKDTKNDAEYKLNIFKLILAGIGNSVGIENLADILKKDPKLIDSLDLKSEYDDKSFKLFSKDGSAYVDAKIGTDGAINSKTGTELNLVKPYLLCGRLNTENLMNWVNGSYTQYSDLSGRIGYAGVNTFWISTSIQDAARKKETGSLYIFSTKGPGGESNTGVEQGPGEKESTKGVLIPWKEMAFDYDEEGEVINPEHPDISELIKQIISDLQPNEIITKLQLTSIANPTWNGIATSGNGTGEPVGPNNTKLTDETFKIDKTSLGNQWRAWRRGNEVATDLYTALGSRIQKGAIEILWKIEKINPSTGVNMAYSIVSKTPSGAPVKNTPIVDKILGNSKAEGDLPIYRYKITFNASSIAKAIPSKFKKITGLGSSTIAFEDLSKGNKIKYKGRDDQDNISDKIVKSGTVLSIEGSKITIETESGNKITIGKDRFISSEKQKDVISDDDN